MWPPLVEGDGDVGTAAYYRSLGKLRPYRGGDLEKEGELKKAATARSYRGELILTYGNEAGTAWIANLVLSLRSVGIEHFLVIVMSDEHCRSLMRPPWLISCAWSSWDFGGCKNKMEMRRLWYSRHHYMSRVISELRLNVAVLDGDISIQKDFYAALKTPPLAAHNLIYTLDHSPSCGDLNVGMAYCQRCAPNGRAQWVLDEGLRREGYFCGGQRSEFGQDGRFWNASDKAGASSGPHNWQEWATARDQKLYSDIVGGSCCGAPQHRLMFPSTHKILDQYAFMRMWGQNARCMTMEPQRANGLQTWWHQLLQSRTGSESAETVAVATGKLASGWHGTGAGELAGWSGHWFRDPPAIAHFVGGAPAGGKVEIMQGLGWWRYDADVVAYSVSRETGQKAGLALPRSFFSSRTQRGIVAFAGAAATVHADSSDAFVRRFVRLRFWLLCVAVLLQRTAVDPQPSCNSSWIISDTRTGHRGAGHRGRWYTPSWPWPFKDGVGVVAGLCSYADGATQPSATPVECCSAIFGPIKGVKCFETAHHSVVEQALAAPQSTGSFKLARAAATLDLGQALVGGQLDAVKLRHLGEALAEQVVWVMPPPGEELPQIRGLSKEDLSFIQSLVTDECREHLQSINASTLS